MCTGDHVYVFHMRKSIHLQRLSNCFKLPMCSQYRIFVGSTKFTRHLVLYFLYISHDQLLQALLTFLGFPFFHCLSPSLPSSSNALHFLNGPPVISSEPSFHNLISIRICVLCVCWRGDVKMFIKSRSNHSSPFLKSDSSKYK